jgi:hypothetical protein
LFVEVEYQPYGVLKHFKGRSKPNPWSGPFAGAATFPTLPKSHKLHPRLCPKKFVREQSLFRQYRINELTMDSVS